MKIDIGADGKILGTKRVSPNGQISGFTEYAGAEVLVILPGGQKPVVRRDAGDLIAEAEQIVRERMELAFREYKNLRQRYADSEEAARAFLRNLNPKNVQGLVARTDAWIRDQLATMEKAAARRKPESPPRAGKKE